MTNSSQKQESKAVNKSNPGAGGRHFIALPNDALHYIHHASMKAEKLFLYAILIDYYNVDIGAAWPSLERLAVAYGKTSKTTGHHIHDLKAVGLLEIPQKGHYIPLEPLSAADFYAKYPDAWTTYQRSINDMQTRLDSDKQRLLEYRDKIRTRN